MIPDLVEIVILLFADDGILVSDTVCGLQNQLNVLCNTANHLGRVVVNLDKSEKKGGHIALCEKWKYDDSPLKIVNVYKYLGVYLSARLSFFHAWKDMSQRGKKGVICIFKSLWSIRERPPSIFFKLFDAQVQPMLSYGAEVWGLDVDTPLVERIHLFALKRFLNTGLRTPSVMIYEVFLS